MKIKLSLCTRTGWQGIFDSLKVRMLCLDNNELDFIISMECVCLLWIPGWKGWLYLFHFETNEMAVSCTESLGGLMISCISVQKEHEHNMILHIYLIFMDWSKLIKSKDWKNRKTMFRSIKMHLLKLAIIKTLAQWKDVALKIILRIYTKSHSVFY